MERVVCRSSLLAVLLAVTILSGATPLGAASQGESHPAASSINAFALDMYNQIKKADANLFFSPYSVSACAAMAYAGAGGNTASQMAKVFRYSLDQKELSRSFASLNGALFASSRAGDLRLNIANAMWGQQGYGFRKEFLELLQSDYGSTLREVDFAKAYEQARQAINRWAEEETGGKIKDLLAPETITSVTVLVLTNAVYFKGMWQSVFEEKATKHEPFTLLDGSTMSAALMRQTGNFPYTEGDSFQALELPYKGEDLSMVVFLPRRHDGLDMFEKSLTMENLDNWCGGLQPRPVRVFLPRFEMTDSFMLNNALKSMGMIDAFSSSADFSGMTGRKDISVSGVIQKTFIKVSEEGTEAAAATGMVVAKAGKPFDEVEFRADRPFIYLIRHRPSGCILFMGRLVRP
ncbi:MAG: serpin family protein [Deltaproteobacteria bacterium]|nr:serpin family protein [Deltaproteobacteria bacterium]